MILFRIIEQYQDVVILLKYVFLYLFFLNHFRQLFFLCLIFLSRRALKLDNNNINAINTYALALFHAGYTQDAIEILNKIKDENLDDYYTNSNLGLFFTSLKKYFEAEKYYQILLKKYPEDCEVLNNLGYIYSKTGREAFAEKLWRDALRIDSSYIPARKNLEYIGYFLSNAGRNRNYNNIILL